MTKSIAKLNTNSKINQIKLLNNNSLFVELKEKNDFMFFPDYLIKEDKFEVNYENYEGNSKLIYDKSQLFSISSNFCNIWNLKNLEDIEISENIQCEMPQILDISFNYDKELFLVLWIKSIENLATVSAFSIKNSQKGLRLKLDKNSKKKEIDNKSQIKTFTFCENFAGETLNLSQFLTNSKEKEKFQQMDDIFQVI